MAGFWATTLWHWARGYAAGRAQGTLAQSVSNVWKHNAALCALVPFARVFVGRIPSLNEVPMPYVSIMLRGGGRGPRSDKGQFSMVTVECHVWVDDTGLADAEAIESAIENAYCDRNWQFKGGRVYDVIDEGPGVRNQVADPTYKGWEVVKILTLRVFRRRVNN